MWCFELQRWTENAVCNILLQIMHFDCTKCTLRINFPALQICFIFISFTICRQQVTVYCMFVAIMAFHARISDPRVGGTYLTLLNTLTNLGGNWCQTLALWLVDGLTWSSCVGASIPGLHCSGKIHAKVTNYFLFYSVETFFLSERKHSIMRSGQNH